MRVSTLPQLVKEVNKAARRHSHARCDTNPKEGWEVFWPILRDSVRLKDAEASSSGGTLVKRTISVDLYADVLERTYTRTFIESDPYGLFGAVRPTPIKGEPFRGRLPDTVLLKVMQILGKEDPTHMWFGTYALVGSRWHHIMRKHCINRTIPQRPMYGTADIVVKFSEITHRTANSAVFHFDIYRGCKNIRWRGYICRPTKEEYSKKYEC